MKKIKNWKRKNEEKIFQIKNHVEIYQALITQGRTKTIISSKISEKGIYQWIICVMKKLCEKRKKNPD